MRASLRTTWSDEEGQGLLEYGLLVALIAMVCVTALTATGVNINALFEMIRDQVAAVL